MGGLSTGNYWIDFLNREHSGVSVDGNKVGVGEEGEREVDFVLVELKLYPIETMVSGDARDKLDFLCNISVLPFGLLFRGIFGIRIPKPFTKDVCEEEG
jgi:hypothetical protein